MSDEKLISRLYQLISSAPNKKSPMEAKWNRMHTMHCVLCAVEKQSAGIDDFLSFNYSSLLNLEVGLGHNGVQKFSGSRCKVLVLEAARP